MKTCLPCWLIKAAVLLMTALNPSFATTQSASSEELIDVASFVNGAYPYIPSIEGRRDIHSMEHVGNQLRGISHEGDGNNLFYISDNPNQKTLYYALAASATIDSFRIRSQRYDHASVPLQFDFAVSEFPSQKFKTVAVLYTPSTYLSAVKVGVDFSIPTKEKITGRYVRVTVSGYRYNSFWNFNFSAYGRFNQPVQSRTDFSGIYALGHWGSIVSLSDLDMGSPQKGTDYGSYLILHQKGMQVSGCYVHGMIISNDDSGPVRVISEVIGSLTGKVENNVIRFTRTSAKYNERRNGAMAFAPTGEGIKPPELYGHLLVMRDSESQESAKIRKMNEEGFQSFGISIFSRIAAHTTPTCAITGKVKFNSVYFNFDSSALTSEDKAALDKVVDAAKAYPGWKFEINGHADSIGSTEYNLKLSMQRAMAVARYLVAQGVDTARLQVNGYGATHLLEGNVHHSSNRRVEIVQQ